MTGTIAVAFSFASATRSSMFQRYALETGSFKSKFALENRTHKEKKNLFFLENNFREQLKLSTQSFCLVRNPVTFFTARQSSLSIPGIHRLVSLSILEDRLR